MKRERRNNRIKGAIFVLVFIGLEMYAAYWKDSIRNPENSAFVVECAFNLGIEPQQVTQRQFNARYECGFSFCPKSQIINTKK